MSSHDLFGSLATICLIIFIVALCIGVAVLYYGLIAYVILWLLKYFGVIKLCAIL